MQHKIPADELGVLGQTMADQVTACVHCGFCLPVCPTYKVLGQEMDSPRGRIILMKEVLEGEMELEKALPHIDRCLGCLACVPACPSGVQYGELLSPFREFSESRRRRPALSRLARTVSHQTLPFPRRFYFAAKLGKLAGPFKSLFPKALRPMLDLLPSRVHRPLTHPEVIEAEGSKRARVAFLKGCVQTVLDPEINAATLRVLAKNGIEVIVVPEQGCCGALGIHTGNIEAARRLARKNLDRFPKDIDAIITNAAGCGSGMKEYPMIFKGDSDEERAREFAEKVSDVTVFLNELGLLPAPSTTGNRRIAYHDACHLANAQGVRTPPRQLLEGIPGLEIVEIPDGEFCCGSAGTYNIEQPEIASELGNQKAEKILETGAEAVAAGNIGCIIQIRKSLEKRGANLPVYHTIQFLDEAYE